MGDLGDSLFRIFSSVRLVQEISRSGTTASVQSPPPVTTAAVDISRDAPPSTLSSTTAPSSNNVVVADDQRCNHEPRDSPSSLSSSFSHTPNNNNNNNVEQPSQQISFFQQQQQTNSYWLPHSVQPIPFSFNNYTPATPSLPFWMASYNYNKPVRGIRSLLLGRSAGTVGATTTSATANAAATSSTTTSSARGHARKHSKHYRRMRASSRAAAAASVRTKSWRMLDENSEKEKSKSQKLLCLWPLPVVTRYVIAISMIVSALNCIGLIHVFCSAPSYVIHRLAVADLLRSPFLFDWSLHGVFIFLWNILILGLFEESLTHMLGGTRRFLHVLGGIFLTVCTLRQGLGYLFSKSTGWAVPVLFFSDSVHECNQGIAPFLFALLTVQSLSIDDKYIMIYGDEDAGHKLTVRKVTLQLLMCLVNYVFKNILWWSLTGLLTGYLAAVVIETCLVRERRSTWDDEKSLTDRVFVDGYYAQRTPLWRLLWSALKKGAIVLLVTLPALLLFNTYYYMREGTVDPSALNMLTQDRYMFSFVVMTAPRRGDPPLLSQTIESYLENWPVDPEPGSLYSRLQMLVYTHFSNHSQYDAAKERFSNDLRGQKYIKWVREDGNEMNQRLHVSKALDLVSSNFESSYIALVEDDFPVCGSKEWHEIENVIYEANINVPDHCGVFVGTGGSGIFLKPDIAKLASRLLLDYADVPPDIIIQQCLRGELPECRQCSQSLVTSKTLLMYHIGFNTSTSVNRVYKKDEFQCGWRHPFNGDPAVHTL